MRAFVSILVMAVVTYLPRVLPISLFQKEMKSKYMKSFLAYVPYAVLSSLTFPAIFYSTGNEKTAIIGTIAAILLAYFEQSLVVVAISAIVVVYLGGVFI